MIDISRIWRRRISKFLSLAASFVLAVIVFREILKTMTLAWHGTGSIVSYTPPFAYHGPLVMIGGIVAAGLLLKSRCQVSPNKIM